MKRSRNEQHLSDDNGKKNISGKILYHCSFPECKFIACTEHNIEHHMRMKHINQPNPSAMSNSSFTKNNTT
jgi:hypothetical protein